MLSKASYLRSASFAAISTLPVILGCALLGATAARAYVVQLDQVGANVVATGSGAFDPTGLTPGAINGALTTFALPGIQPNLASLTTGGPFMGLTPTLEIFRAPSGSLGPTNFGSGGFNTASTSMSTTDGPIVGTNFGSPVNAFLYLPIGYVPGTEITSSATWNSTTLTNLGVSLGPTGSLTWTWGGGGPNQSFTICTTGDCPATPSEIPLPAALPLFGTGLGALGLFGWRRKRRAQAVA